MRDISEFIRKSRIFWHAVYIQRMRVRRVTNGARQLASHVGVSYQLREWLQLQRDWKKVHLQG